MYVYVLLCIVFLRAERLLYHVSSDIINTKATNNEALESPLAGHVQEVVPRLTPASELSQYQNAVERDAVKERRLCKDNYDFVN